MNPVLMTALALDSCRELIQNNMKPHKIYKAIYNILILSWLAIISVYAKAEKKATTEPFVTVDIIVKDTLLLKNAFVEFEMNKGGINTSYNIDKSFYKFQINGSKTMLKIPLSTEINYGRFTYNYQDQFVSGSSVQMPLNYGNNLFIFKKGDSIQIYISKNDVSFLGKGSEKYSCLYLLSKQTDLKTSVEANILYRQKKYSEMFTALKMQLDSSYLFRKDILKHYQSKLDPYIFKLISADCLGMYGYQLIGILSGPAYTGNKRGLFDKAIKETFHRWFTNPNFQKFENRILVESYQYCDYLSAKEKFELYFFISPVPDSYNRNYTFKEMYRNVQSNYTGDLHDKMNLLLFYWNLESKPDASLFFNRALHSMRPNVFKDALCRLQNNFTGNAYPFELADASGNIHRLKDYAGKLVIMDFWFTGCAGCAGLAKEMKPIVEAYKSNPGVVFITVSIDKSKDVWLKSLLEEKYCSKQEVNLFTGGMEDKHPLIQHYNLLGFPSLIFISKIGKVITTSPPRPETGRQDKTNAFISLINLNL
jgi:peroxiredoxin